MCRGVVILQLFAVGSGCFSAGAGEECEEVVPELSLGRSSFLYFLFTAVPYIFEIVIFVLLFELALIVFLNYPFPVFPFR